MYEILKGSLNKIVLYLERCVLGSDVPPLDTVCYSSFLINQRTVSAEVQESADCNDHNFTSRLYTRANVLYSLGDET